MPEAPTAPPPASSPDFTPIPVQNDPSSGSAPPIVPSASPKEINLSEKSGQSKEKSGSGMDEAFSDLDRLFSENEPKPNKAQDKAQADEKAKSQDDAKSDENAHPDDPDAKEEASDAKGEADRGNGKAVSAPELRKAYESLKKEAAELREKIKARGPSEEDVKGLREQYESERTKRESLEKELAQSAYERSPEFMEKHAAPFRNAYQKARERISQFKVTDGEGNSRQASPDDFDAIMQVADDMTAATMSRELFGDTVGPIVMMQREKVQELHGNMQSAIKDAEGNFEKTQKEKKLMGERQTAHLNKLWTTLNTGAAEKYPQLFKPVDGDEKGNELLEKGFKLADRAFMDGEKLEPEEAIKLHSQVRNRAAAFGRLVYQNRNLTSEVESLKKELAQFKDSIPKNGDGRIGKKGEADQYGEGALERYVDR